VRDNESRIFLIHFILLPLELKDLHCILYWLHNYMIGIREVLSAVEVFITALQTCDQNFHFAQFSRCKIWRHKSFTI